MPINALLCCSLLCLSFTKLFGSETPWEGNLPLIPLGSCEGDNVGVVEDYGRNWSDPLPEEEISFAQDLFGTQIVASLLSDLLKIQTYLSECYSYRQAILFKDQASSLVTNQIYAIESAKGYYSPSSPLEGRHERKKRKKNQEISFATTQVVNVRKRHQNQVLANTYLAAYQAFTDQCSLLPSFQLPFIKEALEKMRRYIEQNHIDKALEIIASTIIIVRKMQPTEAS